MNYTTQQNASWQESKHQETIKPAVDMLDLFAEELPIQHDLKRAECFGCIGTVSSTGSGSTISSLSSVSTLD